MGFDKLESEKWFEYLEVFWSTSKLVSAHFELEEDDPDDRWCNRRSSAANGAVPSSTWWWTSGELIYKLQHTDRSSRGLHEAYPSWRKVGQVTRLPEKAATKEGLCDSAWWFEEIRRRSSSPEVQSRWPRSELLRATFVVRTGCRKGENRQSYSEPKWVSGG